jgi:hypothetical protein
MALAKRLPDPEALEALRRETGLEAILVRGGDLTLGKRPIWLALAAAGGGQGLTLVSRDGDELLFEVERGRGAESSAPPEPSP